MFELLFFLLLWLFAEEIYRRMMCLLWILFWEELFPILFLSLSVNFSHMGLVPIWLKFIKSFRKRVWGRTLFKRVFPSKYLIRLSVCSAG